MLLFFNWQLKTQLTETLSKLEAEENERQQVAGDLYKVRLIKRMSLILVYVKLRAFFVVVVDLRIFLFCTAGPAVFGPDPRGAFQSDRQC